MANVALETREALRLALDLELPIDFVTKTCAIIAQRRKGKTYSASILAEEFVAARLPFVALDPTGAWWGLRASADGEHAGLPVVVVGGQHGDVPLERQAGRLIADLVLDDPGYYVLDLSLLGTRAAEREFATAFADRLYRRKMEPGMDFPLHLFVDEADLFVPQEREATGDTVMLGAFQAIVRRGGLHGLGTTLVSQRPALVNKSVLTQLDILILLRLVAGQDQDAIYKSYVQRAGSKEQASELMGSLASLSIGEAWVWEPGADPPIFQRVHIRERSTYNSSATPKPGESRVEPRILADVDLEGLRERMAETVERAKENDPAELRRRLAVLERDTGPDRQELAWLRAWRDQVLDAQGGSAIEDVLGVYMAALADRGYSAEVVDYIRALGTRPAEVQIEQITVSVLTEEDRALLERAASAGEQLATRIPETLRALEAAPPPAPPAVPTPIPVPQPRQPPPAPRAARNPDVGEVKRPHQKVLDALAWWAAVGVHSPSRGQLAFVAGYAHPQSRGFRDPLYSLNANDLVYYPSPGQVALTEKGGRVAVAPPHSPTERELQDRIYAVVGTNRGRMLQALVARHPDSLSREELAVSLGYSHAQSRGFRDPLYRLHSLELVEYPSPGLVRAAPIVFLGRR